MRDGSNRGAKLGSTQQLILELMAEAHEVKGEYPSQAELAEQIGVTPQQVNMSMKGLEERGLVTQVKVEITPNQLTASGRKLLRKGAR